MFLYNFEVNKFFNLKSIKNSIFVLSPHILIFIFLKFSKKISNRDTICTNFIVAANM